MKTSLQSALPTDTKGLPLQAHFKSSAFCEAAMKIGEVARRTGLNPSALRFYEQVGLLPRPRREGGRRDYSPAILNRLAVLQFAAACGFSLREIRELISPLLEAKTISARWKRMAALKIEELDRSIAHAQDMKQHLAAALECCCRDVEACGATIRQLADSQPLPIRLSAHRPSRRAC